MIYNNKTRYGSQSLPFWGRIGWALVLKITLLFVLLFIFFAGKASAQKQLDSLEFIKMKDYQPTISNAVKLSERPVFSDSTKKLPPSNYRISSKKISTVFNTEQIKPAKMVGEPLAKLYKSLLKFGLGNYTTAYGEYFFNNLRSKEYSYGAHLKHLSSESTLKSFGYSGFSDNAIDVYGKKILDKQTLSTDINYSRNVVHQYGYDATIHNLKDDATIQRFNYFSPSVRLQSHYIDSSKWNHDVGAGYYYFGDSYKSHESNFKADGKFIGYYEKQQAALNSSVDYYNNRTNTDTSNNAIIKLNPFIISTDDKWTATLGLSAFMDITQDATLFKFYPQLDFSYYIIDNIFIPYAGVNGGLMKNSYKNFACENPFVSPFVNLQNNTDNAFNVYAGIRGSFSKTTFYNTKASYSKYRNMPFFVTDYSTLLLNRFQVIYDTVTVFNFHGEIGYQQTEKIKIILKGDYNSYNPQREEQAWNKPAWQVSLSGNYNLRDKITATADFFFAGKRSAKTLTADVTGINQTTPITLKGFADINFGLEYRYTKRLSAYLHLNNLAATRYYRWHNYPTQKLVVMGGAAYSF